MVHSSQEDTNISKSSSRRYVPEELFCFQDGFKDDSSLQVIILNDATHDGEGL